MELSGSLSRYRILEKLGAGGMGEVYKAEDLSLLRTVAIKVMKKQATPDSEARFLREARAASAINHPNIITVYEISHTDQQCYIVMEYVRGRSLRDLIAAGSLKPEMIIDIALQVSDALAEAHRSGVIHRDIKPENILVTERGQVKVLDFGLAKASSAAKLTGGDTVVESLTQTGAVMGTLSYMSPEQLRDEPLDERTDIFSFGIALYEMITGMLPFPGASSFDVAASILKDTAMDIRSVPAGLPRGIIDVVRRTLEKDRRNRYSTFADLKRELESLKHQPSGRADEDASAEETIALEPPPEWRERKSNQISSPLSAATKPFGPPTILVLPLEAVGASEESEFIGIGLAHAITTDLAKISGLSVLSKSAGAGRVGKSGSGARELATELGATILLEGEVMRAGQVTGIMARLTDVESGRVIWGAQYRGDTADLFNIQDAVCESVAAALKLSVSSEVRDRIARPATTNIDAFEFYSKGRAFLERRDVKENIAFAIQMFEEALRLDPDFALTHAGLGEAFWLKYQATRESTFVDRAVDSSDTALRLDPYLPQVHISLGIIFHGTGRIERAIEEFERAIALQPLSDAAHRWLGRCYQHKGETERAIAYFQKAIEIRPGYWENYDKLGICYLTFGRYHEAVEQFRRVIMIQPDNYHGYNNLGAMYYFLAQYEDAVAMYQRAIEIYPTDVSYSNIGSSYFYQGRYDEAVTAFKAAIKLNGHNDQNYWNLGDVYLRMGREQDAQEQFRYASRLLKEQLRVNPNDAERLGRLALYQAKLQLDSEAVANVERANDLEPRNTTLMYRRAVVYALTGHPAKAIEYLLQALAHGYSRSEADRDPDLEALRRTDEYKARLAAP